MHGTVARKSADLRVRFPMAEPKGWANYDPQDHFMRPAGNWRYTHIF